MTTAPMAELKQNEVGSPGGWLAEAPQRCCSAHWTARKGQLQGAQPAYLLHSLPRQLAAEKGGRWAWCLDRYL